jgi:hypothetical protein
MKLQPVALPKLSTPHDTNFLKKIEVLGINPKTQPNFKKNKVAIFLESIGENNVLTPRITFLVLDFTLGTSNDKYPRV